MCSQLNPWGSRLSASRLQASGQKLEAWSVQLEASLFELAAWSSKLEVWSSRLEASCLKRAAWSVRLEASGLKLEAWCSKLEGQGFKLQAWSFRLRAVDLDLQALSSTVDSTSCDSQILKGRRKTEERQITKWTCRHVNLKRIFIVTKAQTWPYTTTFYDYLKRVSAKRTFIVIKNVNTILND